MLNEVLRKGIHVSACLGCLYLVFTLDIQNTILFFAIFLINTFIYQKFGLLERIIAIGRRSSGHYLISLGILLSLFLHYFRANLPALIFAMLVLAFSDTSAALSGKYLSNKLKGFHLTLINNKTLLGSLTFFSVTFVIGWYLQGVQKALIFAICLTLIEILSPLGLDNISVPLFAYLLYDFA